MTNRQVAEAFVAGKRGDSSTMKSDGYKLWSYTTAVFQWHEDKILELHKSRHKNSSTTTKQKTLVQKEAAKRSIPIEVVMDFDQVEEEDKIEEGDYTTEDYATFYQYGKPVLHFGEDRYDHVESRYGWQERWKVRLKDHMRDAGYFPNVWQIDDHGGCTLVDMSDDDQVIFLDHKPSVEEAQKLVGGYVEVLKLPGIGGKQLKGRIMLAHEEARFYPDNDFNDVATQFMNRAARIFGKAVILPKNCRGW